jgi:hypothetical protein
MLRSFGAQLKPKTAGIFRGAEQFQGRSPSCLLLLRRSAPNGSLRERQMSEG